MNLIERIFSIQDEKAFNDCCLEVYAFQKENVQVYADFLKGIRRPEPTHYSEIPHLPISFFKSHSIHAENHSIDKEFKSSGTGNMIRSQHFVTDLSIYEQSFLKTYEHFIGKCVDQVIVALLPNYVSQGDSSLVYMVDTLIQKTNNPNSGYYLDDFSKLIQVVQESKASGKQVVLFGVSYALLDLAELKPDFSGVRIIETGGMKGRRKELSKEALHQILKEGFNVDFISSEYGMCELLSQAYSNKDGLFELPNWMKVTLRETTDPFSLLNKDKTGGVNVIDLANLYSCSFIETQDLGRMEGEFFRLMGRFDHSDIRGCNLLVS
jgi:hypothetical protein